jgi:membrane protein
LFAVVGWIFLSDGLSLYFYKFANLNKTYGVLGGGIILLTWLYWSGFLILLGAEFNSARRRNSCAEAASSAQSGTRGGNDR